MYFKKKKKRHGNYAKLKKPVRQILLSDLKKPNQTLFHRSQGHFFAFTLRLEVEFDNGKERRQCYTTIMRNVSA